MNYGAANAPLSEKVWAKILDLHSKGKSERDIARAVKVSKSSVHKAIEQGARPHPAKEPIEKNVFKGDEWVVSLPKTRICTLDELIAHAKVNLDEWEVKQFEATAWEMGYVSTLERSTSKAKVTTEKRKADQHPLYRVAATFIKKRHATLVAYQEENATLRSQLEKLKIKFRLETEMTRRLAHNHFGFDDFLTGLKKVNKLIGDHKIAPTQIEILPPVRTPLLNEGHTEDAVLLISDLHYGERIRREDTSGFQEVNLEVQGNRTGQIAKGAKEVLSLHRIMYPIKTLHVWFGGDIGNGDLHASALSNEINIIEQVHFATNMLKFLMRDLLTLTVPNEQGVVVVENINMLFTVGNHMRIDEKMPYKLQARRTFDWLIYQNLIDLFEGTPNVTVKKDLAPYIFEQIRGHRYMFCHGFQVGYKNSPDAQAKSVKDFMVRARALFDSRQWRQENGLEGETFTHACIGDIHVPLDFPRFTANASLSGQNELGANWMLEPIPAGMQIFGVSEKHQKTWKYFLDVTHIGKADTNSYGEFARKYAKDHNA